MVRLVLLLRDGTPLVMRELTTASEVMEVLSDNDGVDMLLPEDEVLLMV